MPENENTKRLMKILSGILGIGMDSITDNSSPKNTENWDSFNMLQMVIEIEETFNVQFTMDEVVAVTCVRDFKEALKRHGIEIEK